MKQNIIPQFVVQIRIFNKSFLDHKDYREELPTIGEEEIITVFKTENKSDALRYFENLKLKDNPTNKQIHNHSFSWRNVKPFFEARILKYTTKEIEVKGWTWILDRYIDITYRCKIIIDEKAMWSKKLYHLPPILFDSHACPSYLSSREATAFACGVLRKFLPPDSFKFEKITASHEISTLE